MSPLPRRVCRGAQVSRGNGRSGTETWARAMWTTNRMTPSLLGWAGQAPLWIAPILGPCHPCRSASPQLPTSHWSHRQWVQRDSGILHTTIWDPPIVPPGLWEPWVHMPTQTQNGDHLPDGGGVPQLHDALATPISCWIKPPSTPV